MESCLYEGVVRHRRHAPVAHSFARRLFMMYLDLDELPDLFRGRWLWSSERPALARFRREDHLGDPGQPLAEAVRDCVAASGAPRPEGPIRLLTHLRYFGYVFNPVSLFYCFDRVGRRVESVVADVSNTPWNERHRYVLSQAEDRRRGRVHRWRTPKAFHVSPFLPMELRYDWTLREPGDHLSVVIRCLAGSAALLDASLVLHRREITTGSLVSALLRHPALTARVIAGIYTEAWRLRRKGAPVFDYPRQHDFREEVAPR